MTLSQHILPKPARSPGDCLAIPRRRAWPISSQPLAVRGLLFAAIFLLAQLASAQPQGVVQVVSANFTVDTAGALPAGQGVVQLDSANFTVDTAGALPGGQGQAQSDSANFAMNTTGASGVAADSLNFTVNTMGPAVAFSLMHPLALPGGRFQFSFTNLLGASFSVFGTTNLTLPFTNWAFLGTVTDNPPGQYQFTDSMTNNSQRFYRVSSP